MLLKALSYNLASRYAFACPFSVCLLLPMGLRVLCRVCQLDYSSCSAFVVVVDTVMLLVVVKLGSSIAPRAFVSGPPV